MSDTTTVPAPATPDLARKVKEMRRDSYWLYGCIAFLFLFNVSLIFGLIDPDDWNDPAKGSLPKGGNPALGIPEELLTERVRGTKPPPETGRAVPPPPPGLRNEADLPHVPLPNAGLANVPSPGSTTKIPPKVGDRLPDGGDALPPPPKPLTIDEELPNRTDPSLKKTATAPLPRLKPATQTLMPVDDPSEHVILPAPPPKPATHPLVGRDGTKHWSKDPRYGPTGPDDMIKKLEDRIRELEIELERRDLEEKLDRLKKQQKKGGN